MIDSLSYPQVPILPSSGSSPNSSAAGGTEAKQLSPEGQKLRNAALEFEAILLSSWWEQMQKSSLTPDESNREPGFDTLQSLGTRAMSLALASRGGLGIAQLMIRQLSPALKPNEEKAETGND